MMFDGTGNSDVNKLAAKIKKMRTGGRKVVANYVTVDVETAIERNIIRTQKKGRFVPTQTVRNIHKAVSRSIC